MTKIRFGVLLAAVFVLVLTMAIPAYAQDNRINSNDYSAPVAIYCSGGVTVWDINSQGQGSYALGANLQQLGEALSRALSSGQQQQVASGLGNVLYVLPSYELRVVAEPLSGYGGSYVYTFGINTCGQVNVPPYYPPYQPPYQPPYYPPYQPPYQPPYNPPSYHPPYYPPYQPPYQPPYNPPSYGRSYVVQYGDTLGIIARRYGVNMYTLAQANGIYNLNLIYVGQRLRIP